MRILLTACAVTCFAAPGAFAQLYSQPIDPSVFVPGTISEGSPGGFFDRKLADNFTLAATSTVDGITWWGSEEEFFSVGFPGNIAGFNVEIFTSVGGLPGASVFQTNALIGSLNVTPVATPDPTQSIQRIDLDLTGSPINLVGGTEYWLSVGALPVTDFANDDSFFWANAGLNVDGLTALDAPINGSFASLPGDDLAFELNGVIPEPASLGMLGLAAGFLVRRRSS